MPKTTAKKSSDSESAKSKKHPHSAMATRGRPTMEELLASTGYHVPALRPGQEVSGKIVSISHSEILIDIGAKSEGIIFGRELSSVHDYVKTLAKGDKIDAVVLYPENDAGQVVLSLRKHSLDKRWSELEEKRDDGEAIEAVALEANRGGVICEWMGIRGFLPASQLLQGTSNMADLIGKSLNVQIIELDRDSNRLILSQRQPGKEELEAIQKLLKKIKIGEKFNGVVTAVLPFGLFVEIEVGVAGEQVVGKSGKKEADAQKTGKLEGLVHISEISWEKIEDVSKHFKVGQKVEVMVIDTDEGSGRLGLSIKQLSDDPFLKTSEKYSKDQEVTGTVSKVTPYGVFVNLESGVEGMIHISKLSPEEVIQEGQSLKCIVEAVDAKARKISLVPIKKQKPILYR